jgi:hypothetical protein
MTDTPADTPDDAPDESGPDAASSERPAAPARRGPRLYERGRFWLALIVVEVVGAVVVSSVAGSSGGIADPPDQAAYCAQARALASRGELHLDVGRADEIVAYQAVLGQLAEAANPSIRRDIEAVRASLDPVVAAADAATPGDPGAIPALADRLDQATNSVQAQAARVSAYTTKWCGFDVNDPALATTTSNPVTVPTPVPTSPSTTGG